jgi:SAM-dependent methyltransferase
MTEAAPLTASPLHALCVYAEPLVAGRRVVVFGDATARLGERMLELGARVVHVYDPQPSRVASLEGRVQRGLSVHPLPAGDFDVRDGAFDVAVVADIADVPAPAPLLARIRRLLAPGGAALVRSRSVEGAGRGRPRQGALDYYELYDLVALQFSYVRMVGQIPWAGVALAELGRGEGEPDVTVDTQLVPESDAPEAFIALGSQDDVRLAEYALVQLPGSPGAAVDVEATIAYGSERADLAAAQLRASLLEAQVEELRAARNRDGAARSDAVATLEAELAEAHERTRREGARAAEVAARADQATAQVRALADELARERDRAAVVHKELEAERRARARADEALGQSRQTLEAASLDARGLAVVVQQVPALEAALRELEARLAVTTQQLAATDDARSRLEVALAAALLDLDAARGAVARGMAAEELAVALGARSQELEARVQQLESRGVAPADSHAEEIAALEAALRERGRATQVLELELARRERIVLDLVHALEEVRDAVADPTRTATGPADDARLREAEGAIADARRKADRVRAENDNLRAKLDAAALEIARREAELATSAWRVQELEQAVGRLEDEQSELTMTIPPPAFVNLEREANDVTVLTQRLTAAEDELDLLRQALAQEHEARLRVGEETGEAAALAQARADLARQAELLEKLSRELEARGDTRAAAGGHADGGPGGSAAGAA